MLLRLDGCEGVWSDPAPSSCMAIREQASISQKLPLVYGTLVQFSPHR